MAYRGLKRIANRKVAVLLALIFIALVFYKLMSDFDPPQQTSLSGTQDLLRRRSNTSRLSSYVISGDSTAGGSKRTNQYCNSPFEEVKGKEGLGPQGFNLRMVHVFIRHGDRTPIYKVPGYTQPNFDCNFRKWYPENGDNEKFKRFPAHMDHLRDPDSVFGRPRVLYPNKNICDEQSLTNRGALQHLNLGQYLNDRYILGNGLLDDKVSLKEQIHVRTTRYSRTFQSAMAFMYGFFPSFDTSDLSFSFSDSLFMCMAREKPCRCGYAEKLYSKYHKVGRPVTNSSSQAEVLAKMLNVDQEHVRGIGHLLDAFLPAVCHGKSTMCSSVTPFTCIDQAKVEYMWNEYINAEVIRIKEFGREVLKYSYLHLYPVLREIMRRIQKFGLSQSSRKFTLYSGHDTTLQLLLSVFGLYDGTWVPYSSRLAIETYNSSSQEYKGKLFIRILYNGNDVTNDVSFCKGRLVNTLCDFERFTTFMSSTMLELFGKSDFRDVCAMDGR